MRVVISQVASMVVHNTFVIFMIVIGIIICNIMFTYTYGMIEQFKELDSQPDVIISYKAGERKSAYEVDKQLTNNAAGIDYYSIISLSTSDSTQNINLNNYLIRSRKDSNYFYTIVGSSKSLSHTSTVLIPKEFFEQYKINDFITLNGRQYTVVGVVSMPYFVISFDSYVENIKYPDIISIKVKDDRSIAESTIKSVFAGYDINVLSESNQVTEQIYKMYVSTLSVYAVSLLALLCLLTYIFEKYSYELGVYTLAGASYGKIKIIIFLTIMSFVIFSDIAAWVIHMVAYNSLFIKLNLVDSYKYYIKDYCKIYMSSFVVTFIYIAIQVNLRFRKDTLTNMRRNIT